MHTIILLCFVPNIFLFENANGQKPQNSRLNFFDMDILRYAAEAKSGNVLVSPASIKSTLAMLLEGSRGSTGAEIRDALRLSPEKDDFREQLNAYLSALNANTSKTHLKNANAVFMSEKLQLMREYEAMLRSLYFTDVQKLSFRDPVPAATQINSWVSNVTRGLISNVVQPVNINPSTDILLINSLYFKSSWKRGFDPKRTNKACFFKQGVCHRVAMMEQQAELNYAYVDNLRAHAVELPYEGERYSMIVVVPLDRDGSAALIRDLPYMSLSEISKQLEPADVILTLPKFTVEYSNDMVETLKAMQIKSLFSSKANLSGMFNGSSPLINNIFHKVHLSVDESGTEAAASTAAMVIPLIQGAVQLKVDRPFIFFLRDNSLGLILFEGRIEEPTALLEMNNSHGPANIQKIEKNFERTYNGRYKKHFDVK